MQNNILAIDIGGSKLVVGIVDAGGSVLQSQKELLPPEYDMDYILDVICRMAESYIDFNPVAAGVTIPGLADSQKGVWCYAPFSGISDVPIAEILSEKLNLDVYIENDVNACAVGEKIYGACKEKDDFLWITVSNGIGGALYLQGKLYTGATGNAGEIGHFIVEEDTEAVCGCGKCGCLEAMASGKGIERAYAKITGMHKTAQEIALQAKAGDAVSAEVFEKAGGYIGKALAYAVNLLNLQTVVIGGGVSESFDLLAPFISKALDKYIFRQGNRSVCIQKTGLGYYAALVGAAAVAKTRKDEKI